MKKNLQRMKGIIPQGKPCISRLQRLFAVSRRVLNLSFSHSLDHVRASPNTISLCSSITFLLLTLTIFSSCIGLSMDIQLRKDGSARLSMEYRISAMAEIIGKLDGNENWPIVPVGRADWERTTERIPGAKLVSFSSRQSQKEIVTNVTLNFENIEAMLKFLDSAGKKTSLGAGYFELILNEPVSSAIDNNLLELVRQVTDGYTFTISFSTERNSNLTITDGNGKEIPIPNNAQVVSSVKKVSLLIAIYEILTLTDGLGVRFNW